MANEVNGCGDMEVNDGDVESCNKCLKERDQVRRRREKKRQLECKKKIKGQ